MPGQMGLSRRQFLRLAALATGGMWLPRGGSPTRLPEWPQVERLGRVTVGRVDRKLRPAPDSPTVDVLYQDAIVPWLREVVGERLDYNRFNQRWVETDGGYIYGADLQPVTARLNEPVTDLGGQEGFWVEVTVPYVDLILANPPARAFWLKVAPHPRLYYSQVIWVDRVRVDDDGVVWYRINERYGNPGDIFWAEARAFRMIQPQELEPINPEAEDKLVRVNVTDQTLCCLEGGREVYFCRVSTGYRLKGKWETPIGKHPIWRKLVSLHMSGGTTGGGWDLPGVGWTSLFVGSGVAIHSTFWHNDFGTPRSHGCVNARPQDAHWIFRWVEPPVEYEPGDRTIGWPGGTQVEVIEL